MKFLHSKIFIAIMALLLQASCKKETTTVNHFIEVDGQKILFEIKDATLLVNSNANTIAIATEPNSASDKISFFIQNNSSTTVDCIDRKNYPVTANGWNGSTFSDNCAIYFLRNSISYTSQLNISGAANVTRCDNLKLFSVTFSAWLYASNQSDSVFISNGVFENIQLTKP